MVSWLHIPGGLGPPFRRNLGARSGATWALIPEYAVDLGEAGSSLRPRDRTACRLGRRASARERPGGPPHREGRETRRRFCQARKYKQAAHTPVRSVSTAV